jgi:dCTP deaminase
MKEQEVEDIAKEQSGGALTREEILKRLTTEEIETRIFFTPMISSEEQVKSTAIDVRLGNQFILFKRTKYPILDVCETKQKDLSRNIGKYHEKVYVAFGERLILHPGQLVLGCTLEYIRLPCDLMAEVIGRSSWGRLGLIISAATLVHPGYAGVITLELANEGETPLALYPGVRISQLVFSKLLNCSKSAELSATRYLGSVEPMFSKLHEDPDLEILRKLRDQ